MSNPVNEKVPSIVSVSREQRPVCKGTINARWGTDVSFNNGVILKFSGKLKDDYSKMEASRLYRQMQAAGWTEAELIDKFSTAAVQSTSNPQAPATSAQGVPNA